MAKAKPKPQAEKGVLEKIADAVDHVIHPEAHADEKPSLDEAIGEAASKAERSSSFESDYAKHPKFSKFKTQEGEPLP